MLAGGRTTYSGSLARSVLLLLLGLALVSSLQPLSRAELPTQVTNGDASRTVTWTMNTTDGLRFDNATLESGRAVLPWVYETLAWTDTSQIETNGTMDPTMTANESGLSLHANWSSYVANPWFDGPDPGPWLFANGTSDYVTAEWNASLGAADLRHTSPSTESTWDSMDDVVLNWAASAGGTVYQNTSTPVAKEGTGSLGLGVVAPGVASVAAINQSVSPTDWSAHDRLVLWVYLNTSIPSTFNVTAHHLSDPSVLTTAAQPLRKGWQEIAVDLNQLGEPAVRQGLTKIALVFSGLDGSSLPFYTWFDIDDVRLGSAKVFDETATVSQLIHKSNATTSLPGSSILAFDWCLGVAAGVKAMATNVSLETGSGTVFSAPLGPAGDPACRRFVRDVSAATTAAGTYSVSFGLRVAANNTTASHAELRIDNVTLVFPEIRNGTFLSDVLSMGKASEFLSLEWSGIAPGLTSISVGLRTGNNTNPESTTWSPWDISVSPGRHFLDVSGASYFQIRIDLETTNASQSPVFQGLTLETRHRGNSGSVTSDLFPANADFLRWRSFDASMSPEAQTSVVFWLGNGTSWMSYAPGANLSSYDGGPQLRWQATLVSSDGLRTPALFNVTAVYEFLGPVAHVRITPGGSVNASVGQWKHFQAGAYDAGWHPLPLAASAFVWSGGDPDGKLYNNGSYLPAKAGLWNVTVSALGFSDTVLVVVSNGTVPSGPNSGPSVIAFVPYALAIVAAAGLGFAGYEFAVRRMFAVDDVFVISRDGRLMVHNTRRMRADRDEDVLSGMLTAMITFLRDWDPEENGKAKRFDYGDKTALIEHGERVYVAAVYSGHIPGWASKDLKRFVHDLEAKFGPTFAHWTGSPQDLHGLREFTNRFVSRTRYRGDGTTS